MWSVNNSVQDTQIADSCAKQLDVSFDSHRSNAIRDEETAVETPDSIA